MATIEELNSLPIVQDPNKVPWLKDSDPRGYYDADGVMWLLMRTPDGSLVRFRPVGGPGLFRLYGQ